MTVVKPLVMKSGLIREIAPDDELMVETINVQTMFLGTELTPPILNANTNNYSPTGIDETIILNISSSGNINLTGILLGDLTKVRNILVVNVGTNNILMKNNDAASSAAARFLIGADKNLQQNEGINLFYSVSFQRWRAAGVNI